MNGIHNDRLTISIQTAERNFEGDLHFVVTDDNQRLIAASYIGYETVVRALSAGIIEKRNCMVGQTILKPLHGEAYKRKEKPIGMGDIYHGVLIPRHSSWNDIKDDENIGLTVQPYIFAPDGNLSVAVGKYLRNKFNLPVCWENHYFSLLEENHYVHLTVKINPLYPFWNDLKVVQLKISETELLQKIEAAMKQGTLKIPEPRNKVRGDFESGWSLKEFIQKNAVQLATKLSEVRPYFDPEVDKLHWGFRLMKRTPFPAQAYKIQGLVNSILSKDKESNTEKYDIGDMGTGKSISLCGILLIYHLIMQERGRKRGTSCLLSAPSITIPKWESKEIMPTIPDFAKVEIIDSTEAAIRVLNKVRSGHKPDPNHIEWYLIGLDRAKLGHEPYFAGIWKRVNGKTLVKGTHSDESPEVEYAWHCPDCGEVIMIKDKMDWYRADYYDFVEKGIYPDHKEIEKARKLGSLTRNCLSRKNSQKGILAPNGIPVGFVKKWRSEGTPKKCQACHTPLWRPALKSRFETRNKPRYNSSRILKKVKKYFDFFAQDECQQTKAEDSGRGDAYAQMVKAAKITINLTGTLTTGKSTSVKEIIWRANPGSLLSEGFDYTTGMVAWARRYGVLREVFEYEEQNKGVITRRKRKALQPKEDPGIAPALVTNHLLHKAAFTELKDLGLPLVKLTEIPEIIQMDAEHFERYRKFHESLFDMCKTTGNWGKFIPATINYGDRPDLGAACSFYDRTSGKEFIIAADPMDGRHSKLRRLIDIVKQELSEDRKVIIFNKFTDGYGMNEYIQSYISQEGIQAEILSTSTSTTQRFEWLQRQADRGTQVLICNMGLVEVGLDLQPWPTIIYYQLDYDINKIRQSSRRAWRIGQTRECRIYYLVYDDSTQLDQFRNIMAKRGHALLVEGRLDRSELAQYSYDGNTAMATEIAETLSSAQIADMWRQLAAKDIDKDLELVEESDFKVILQERMQQLSEQTLSKCLPVPEKYQLSNIEEKFKQWIKYFASPWREKLTANIKDILKGIQDGRIQGFVLNDHHFYFDEIAVFGFKFVDELAIVEYIFSSIGLSLYDQKTIFKKEERCESSEVPDQYRITTAIQKTKGRMRPTFNQLSFDLFG